LRQRTRNCNEADVETNEQRILAEPEAIRFDDGVGEQEVHGAKRSQQQSAVAIEPQRQPLDLAPAERDTDGAREQAVAEPADGPRHRDQERKLEEVVQAKSEAVHRSD
jgi:hypothetical protein